MITTTARPEEPDPALPLLSNQNHNGSNGAAARRLASEGVVLDAVADTRRMIPDVDFRSRGLIPADAVARALRDVQHERVGVIGRHATIVAEWLRHTGYDAQVLVAPGKKAPREKRGSRIAKADVIVSLDCIDHSPSTGVVLRQIKELLSPQGRLIAVVPNATHASVRLAMLLGRYSFRAGDSTLPQYASTAADAERLLNASGFTVMNVERQVDSVDLLKQAGSGVPEAVLQLLLDDADAMTSHFAFVAEPDGAQSAGRLLNRRLGQLADEQREVARNAARIDHRVADLEVRVSAIAERAAATSDAGRDVAFCEARERYLARTADLAALIDRIERARYRRLILKLRDLVTRATPRGAIVAVVSRGDDALLAFEGRRGWHFPQTEQGVYAGHHPRDSRAAIAHAEQLRARGARYLVVPRTALWWLDYYQEFHQHLLRHGGCLLHDERVGALFALGGRGRSK